jgi:hypothetical protein
MEFGLENRRDPSGEQERMNGRELVLTNPEVVCQLTCMYFHRSCRKRELEILFILFICSVIIPVMQPAKK